MDPLPVEDNIEHFRIWCHEESDSGFGYAIRNQEGLCVGCISAWGIADPERDATLSIMVGPYYQGHGYGSQALTIALHRLHDMRVATITVRVAAHLTFAPVTMFAERGLPGDRPNAACDRARRQPLDIIVMRRAPRMQ